MYYLETKNDFTILSGWKKFKSGLLHDKKMIWQWYINVNKVLAGHIVMAAFMLQYESGMFASETKWPTSVKYLLPGPFTEEVLTPDVESW